VTAAYQQKQQHRAHESGVNNAGISMATRQASKSAAAMSAWRKKQRSGNNVAAASYQRISVSNIEQ